MKIVDVDSFMVEVPLTDDQIGKKIYNNTAVTRVRTDAGLTGYGFSDRPIDLDRARPILLGADPFAIERHVADGLVDGFQEFGAENALWDIVGKAAGLPLHKLWGACRDRILLYLTCVWEGAADQTDVTPREQAEMIGRYAELGYRAVKIRIWRPDPMEDVETVRLVRELVGGRERMEVMLDRTGDGPGEDWDHDTALRAARGLEEVDATWLEEPFVRGDIERHARLRAEVDIPVTGGEHQPPEVYPPYLRGEAFDIVQPHCAGTLSRLRKIAGMIEQFGAECIFHGSHGMNLVGSLQLGATIPTCRTQEHVYTTPPLTFEDTWAPLNALVTTDRLFEVQDGYVRIPDAPGLGIEVDEEAIDRYRVDG